MSNWNEMRVLNEKQKCNNVDFLLRYVVQSRSISVFKITDVCLEVIMYNISSVKCWCGILYSVQLLQKLLFSSYTDL